MLKVGMSVKKKISHLQEDGTLIEDRKKRTEYELPNGGRIISYQPYKSMQIIFFDIRSPWLPDLWKLGFRKGGDTRFLRTLICRQGSCLFTVNGVTNTLPQGQVMMDYGIGDDGTFNFTADEFRGVEIAFQPNELVNESAMFRMLRFVIEGMMLPEEDIFDSDGYLFPYSKNTEQTVDKLFESGMNGENLMVLTHTVEVGNNLGGDLKRLSMSGRKKSDEKQQKIAEDIYTCLTENFEQKNTAAQFAAKYDVSDTAVKNYFRNYYGYGYKEYQTKVRMEWAAERLVETDWSIGYISERAGYAKHTKFTAAFKKYYGVTPSVYRRNEKRVKAEENK